MVGGACWRGQLALVRRGRFTVEEFISKWERWTAPDMDKEHISVEEFQRRVEGADSETLQVLHALLREELRRQRRSYYASFLTTLIGLITLVYSVLPNARPGWVAVAGLAIALTLGYVRLYAFRSLQVDRIVQLLTDAGESKLAPEEVQRLRSEIVRGLFGKEAS